MGGRIWGKELVMFSLPKDNRAASCGKRIRRGGISKKCSFFIFYYKYQCVDLLYRLFSGSVSGKRESARQDADMPVEMGGQAGRKEGIWKKGSSGG